MANTKTLRNKTKKKSSFPNSLHNSSTMPLISSQSHIHYKWLTRGLPILFLLFVTLIFGISLNGWVKAPSSKTTQKSQTPQIYTADVVNEFRHDPKAFTQGLLYWKNDTLYESIGLYGRSALRRVALRTGKVEAEHKMDASSFGEGLTLLGEKFYQLTWLSNIGYTYDRKSLSKLASFTHQMNDGWGLATDGKILFGSDGSSTLYQMDPKTMKVLQKHIIKYEGHEVHYLNELEYINGEVWANIWQTDCIVKISPKNGTVVGWILLPKLREELIASGEKGIDVLNGIAWDSWTERIFVTGKLWPKLFEIKLKPVKDTSQVNITESCIIRMPFYF